MNDIDTILKEIVDNLLAAVSFPFAPSVKLGKKAKYELCLRNVLEEASRIQGLRREIEKEGK